MQQYEFDEELLESLYWDFTDQRNKQGDERSAFKGKVRFFAAHGTTPIPSWKVDTNGFPLYFTGSVWYNFWMIVGNNLNKLFKFKHEPTL